MGEWSDSKCNPEPLAFQCAQDRENSWQASQHTPGLYWLSSLNVSHCMPFHSAPGCSPHLVLNTGHCHSPVWETATTVQRVTGALTVGLLTFLPLHLSRALAQTCCIKFRNKTGPETTELKVLWMVEVMQLNQHFSVKIHKKGGRVSYVWY